MKTMTTQRRIHPLGAITIFTAAALASSGCGIGSGSVPTAIAGPALHGTIFGGQQPVSGSTLQLYAAGTTGYGSAATPLLTSSVLSDSSGNFSITGKYTCPSASAEVYIVATGGNALATPNPSLAMMDALGPCGNLGPSTFVFINELTTVAAVWSLSPFMTGPAAIGSTPTNSLGLANAFDDVNTLADTGHGTSPGPGRPTGATVPSTEINTLGNILAACVNSTGGTAGDGTPCGNLFNATKVSGVAPSDTITAAMNIAQHPASNVLALYQLVAPSSPFQPSLSAQPNDFTVAITFSQSITSPSTLAADSGGNIWITNKNEATATKLSHTGSFLLSYTGTLNSPSGIAIDSADNAWVTNSGNNTISRISSSGSAIGSPVSGGGLSVPRSIAFDSIGNAWVANYNGAVGSVSAFTSDGAAISGVNGFTAAGITGPSAIAVSPH